MGYTTIVDVDRRINILSDENRRLRASLPLDTVGLYIPERTGMNARIEGNEAEMVALYTQKRQMKNDLIWHRPVTETTAPQRDWTAMLVAYKRRRINERHAAVKEQMRLLQNKRVTLVSRERG